MKFAVLDFETTGTEPQDRIIQVGVAVVEEGNVAQTFASFVRPGIPIPETVQSLTGIDDAMVEGAPELDDVLIEMLPLLGDAVLVAHNAPFDIGFLQRALEECGYGPYVGRVLDTLDLLRFLYPGLSGLSLGHVCRSLGIPHERAHRADSDAEATALILLRCLERLDELPLITVQRLHSLFAASPVHDDLAWFLGVIRERRELEPAIPGEERGSFFRQFHLRIGEWGGEEARTALSGEEETALGDDFELFYESFKTRLQQKLDRYEQREAQETMIREVYGSLTRGEHLLVEAGTGTGKSLGYLIPSIYYSLQTDEKVVISTNTINLQDQIRYRDIPLLQELFPVPFRAAVLKGRSHYLCLRKFDFKISAAEFENPHEDPLTAAQLVVWLGETESGDEEELHLAGKGRDFWRTVESDSESCLNRACPWFKRCYYHRARHEAQIADVIITNHSLLFTDIKAEHRLLPAYRHLVVDEAHQFEETAGKHLGTELGYFSLAKPLARLYADARNGLLPQLAFRLRHAEAEGSAEPVAEEIEACMSRILEAKEIWDRLTERLFELTIAGSRDTGQSDAGQLVLRIRRDNLPPGWDDAVREEHNLHVELGDLIRRLERAAGEAKELVDEPEDQGLVTDLNGVLKELARIRDAVRFLVDCGDEAFVYWLEAVPNYRSKSLRLVAVPIDVGQKLREHFFENKESVILTSATLSVGGSFRYACEQLGLADSFDPDRLRTVQLPASFNYREQALVCVPRDFPSVRGNADLAFVEALSRSLAEVAVQTKGRMMVLFTSYRMLRQVHALLREPLGKHGIQVLAQGVSGAGRTKLIRQFQEQSASVLLGTSSFWEGVDIPGQALTCLAIVRLPFQPPNHPLVEAKNDAAKRQNKNPFMTLSVPQAVIRFKQGFGRLVRTAQDRGIVIVYDTRVIDTKYGRYFLHSLPGPKIEHLPTKLLVPRIREWLEQEEGREEGRGLLEAATENL